MIMGEMLHAAYREVVPSVQSWREMSAVVKKRYGKMAVQANIEAGICPQCGCIPVHGLSGEDFCGTDCPGQDSGKWCDHQNVGAVVRNTDGYILMFKRNTYPFALAGPAGHCDGDNPDVAIRKEVEEEVGLHVVSAKLVTRFWQGARCRRRYAGMPGHYWSFFEVVAEGELVASVRETLPDSLRWYPPEEVGALVVQTEQYLDTGDTSLEYLDLPWYWLFCDLGV